MIISRHNRPPKSIWLIFALGLILQLLSLSTTAAATTSAEVNGPTPQSSAGQNQFSWEQTQADEIPGPGAFFDSLLTRLSRQSDDSEDRFRSLWAGVPQVLPDLYKVFITL